MSFRLDWQGTIVLTVILVAASYLVRPLLPYEQYCMFMVVLVIAVFAIGNHKWIKYQLRKRNTGRGDDY